MFGSILVNESKESGEVIVKVSDDKFLLDVEMGIDVFGFESRDVGVLWEKDCVLDLG